MPKLHRRNARAANNSAPGKANPDQSRPSTFTTVPIEHDSDWVRLPKQGQCLCGLGRAYIYQLAKGGLITAVALRQPGKARGVRLIYKPSILAFIEKQAAIQNSRS